MSSRGAPGSCLSGLHPLQSYSYSIFCFLQSSTVSSLWLHGLQLLLPHFWPDQGFLLLNMAPRLLPSFSTTFRVNPIIGDSLVTVDLIPLASMPPLDLSTNRMLETLISIYLGVPPPPSFVPSSASPAALGSSFGQIIFASPTVLHSLVARIVKMKNEDIAKPPHRGC